MSNQIEKTQKVVELTGVSYTDAKDALERTDWDVLSAIVTLEREGKVERKTATYTTGQPNEGPSMSEEMLRSQRQWEETSRRNSLSESARRLWEEAKRFLMVSLVVEQNDREVAVIPMFLVLVLLLVFRMFAVIAVIASLFFGVRYRFDGIEAVTFDVNGTMDRMADMADSIANGVGTPSPDAGSESLGADEPSHREEPEA